jgi:hypothetical protein
MLFGAGSLPIGCPRAVQMLSLAGRINSSISTFAAARCLKRTATRLVHVTVAVIHSS